MPKPEPDDAVLVQLSTQVPKRLRRELRVLAMKRDTTMQELVVEILQGYVAEETVR